LRYKLIGNIETENGVQVQKQGKQAKKKNKIEIIINKKC
jgi:hypothetical protein